MPRKDGADRQCRLGPKGSYKRRAYTDGALELNLDLQLGAKCSHLIGLASLFLRTASCLAIGFSKLQSR